MGIRALSETVTVGYELKRFCGESSKPKPPVMNFKPSANKEHTIAIG